MGWFKKIFGGSKHRSSRYERRSYGEHSISKDRSNSSEDENRSPQRTAKDDEDNESSYNRTAENDESSYNHNNGYEFGFQYPSYYSNYGDGTRIGYQEYESQDREQYGNWGTELWRHFSRPPQSGNVDSATGYRDPYYGDQGSYLYGDQGSYVHVDPHYRYIGSYLYGEPHYGYIGSASFRYGEPSDDDQGPSTSKYGAGFFVEQGYSTPAYPTSYGEQVWNHSTCYVCESSIWHGYSSTSHPFWQQPRCRSHDYDGTPMCLSCQRLKPRDAEYTSLVDGRLICSECRKTAIMDKEACQELYHDAKRFFRRLGMEIESRIPVHLVDANEMRRHFRPSGRGSVADAQGLCVLGEATVKTIRSVDDDEIIERTCELDGDGVVKGILILYGLPSLVTGSIMVHELMHAWFRLEGYPFLRDEVEEGMAQVMAHRWVCSETDSSYEGGWQSRFGEFVRHLIATNEMPNYGSGFRRGLSAVENYGLEGTLDHIRSTGEFPW